MFFEVHDEKRIGYKTLTAADLGRSSTSHQTHIGLFDDVLQFLPDKTEIKDALFIYEDTCDVLFVKFDRILRRNGEYNSPKISTGGLRVVSVVSAIRDIVREHEAVENWYLFWFGLKSGQPVFFLFNDQSKTFSDILSLGITLEPGIKNRIVDTDASFKPLMSYLETLVNIQGADIIKEVETVAQLGTLSRRGAVRHYDIKKAEKIFEEIGRQGEELVDGYFAQLLATEQIDNYVWFNQDGESGLPYDFSFQKNGDIVFLDVKTTSRDFEQPIVFSAQELRFIAETPNKYCVYRVYNFKDETPLLRICSNYKPQVQKLLKHMEQFISDISAAGANLQSLKMTLPTVSKDLEFGKPIYL